MGAIKVCREVTGFSTSVDFSNGKAEYDPTVTAQQKLISGDFDAALLIGDDSIFSSPGPVTKALAKIPFVYIGPQRNTISQKATISLLTTENGIFTDGSMNRMDMKEISLLPIDDSSLPLPSELDLITRIHQSVKNNS
jgi:formylmethanofuran dehydrogenase subunit B